LFEIWQLFTTIVDEAGQVSKEPDAVYDPDPALPEIEAKRLSPVFLYVLGIVRNI
jgi:hypothetical protein